MRTSLYTQGNLENKGAASPGGRVAIYWYQDLSGETLKNPTNRQLGKHAFFADKGVSNWGAPPRVQNGDDYVVRRRNEAR